MGDDGEQKSSTDSMCSARTSEDWEQERGNKREGENMI